MCWKTQDRLRLSFELRRWEYRKIYIFLTSWGIIFKFHYFSKAFSHNTSAELSVKPSLRHNTASNKNVPLDIYSLFPMHRSPAWLHSMSLGLDLISCYNYYMHMFLCRLHTCASSAMTFTVHGTNVTVHLAMVLEPLPCHMTVLGRCILYIRYIKTFFFFAFYFKEVSSKETEIQLLRGNVGSIWQALAYLSIPGASSVLCVWIDIVTLSYSPPQSHPLMSAEWLRD